MITPDGYNITLEGGKLIVHDVPIFAECYRAPRKNADGSAPSFDGHYTAKWIQDTVDVALLRHSEGYEGPVHIRHHEKTATGDEAKPAGTFRVTGTKSIQYQGRPCLAVMADLTITNPAAQTEVMGERLPFRSIEILHPDSAPEFDSVALLDHEVPFMRLPNLRIAHVNDRDGSVPTDAAAATFSDPWTMETLDGEGPMVACFSQGTRTALLFREDPMAAKKKTKDTFGAGVDPKASFADDDEKKKPKGDDGEEMTDDGGFDIAPIVKAIEDGSISIADMGALAAAIDAAKGAAVEEVPNEPAPADIPAQAMKADATNADQFAANAAELVTLRSEVASMKSETTREKEVTAALKRLEGRGLHDLTDELTKFHADHGSGAFGKFVDHLAKHNGTLPPEKDSIEGLVANASDLALTFADHGNDAVKMAAHAEEEWEWMSKKHGIRLTKEQYVKINMEKALSA